MCCMIKEILKTFVNIKNAVRNDESNSQQFFDAVKFRIVLFRPSKIRFEHPWLLH